MFLRGNLCGRLIYIIVQFFSVFSYVPESELIPFLDTAHSVQSSYGHPGVYSATLDLEFMLFNKTYRKIYISENGYITFGQDESKQHLLSCAPNATETPTLVVYGCPGETSPYVESSGALYFQEETNRTLLEKVSKDISKAFPNMTKIELKWMAVVTWYKVAADDTFDSDLRNSFQAVLTSDHLKSSFVLYYYTNITYTNQHLNSFGTTVGIFGGSGATKQTYLVPGSCSDRLENVTQFSNMNCPGKFVFKVDQTTVIPLVSPMCQFVQSKNFLLGSSKQVHFIPRVFTLYGESKMMVKGLSPNCLTYTTESVTCIFRKSDGTKLAVTTTSQLGGNFELFCHKPFLNILGLVVVDVEVQFSQNVYLMATGNILIVPEGKSNIDVQLKNWVPNGYSEIVVKFDLAAISNDLEKLLRLPANLITHQQNELEINLVELQGQNWNTLERFECINENETCSKILSSKDFKLATLSDSMHTSLKAVSIYNTAHLVDNIQLFTSHMSDPISTTMSLVLESSLLSRSNIYDKRCKQWYDEEPSPPNDTLPCPSNVFQAEMDWRFQPSKHSSTQGLMNPDNLTVYLQATPSTSGAGSLCVYNKENQLELTPPYGSRIYRYSPNKGYWDYYHYDIVPYLDCCLLSFASDKNCAKYFWSKRPPYQKGLYKFPIPFRATGAAQITSLGGSANLLNEVGWFSFASFNDNICMEIQLDRFSSNSHFFTGTVITNAIILWNNPQTELITKLQISVDKQHGLLVWLDDKSLNFYHNEILNETGLLAESLSIQQNHVSISVNGSNEVTVSISNDVSVKFLVTVGNRSIDILGSVCTDAVSSVKGLIDKNKANIKNLKMATPIFPLQQFPEGNATDVTGTTTYGKTRPEVLSKISDPIALFCNHDQNCMVDYQLTGDQNFTTSTMISYQKFISLVGASKFTARKRECKIPQYVSNGYFSGTFYHVGAEIEYSCEPGYEIRAKFPNHVAHLENLVFTCVPLECLYAATKTVDEASNQTWIDLQGGWTLNNMRLECIPLSNAKSAFWTVAASTLITSTLWIVAFALYRICTKLRKSRVEGCGNNAVISLLDLTSVDK